MTPMSLIFQDSSAVTTGAEAIASDGRFGAAQQRQQQQREQQEQPDMGLGLNERTPLVGGDWEKGILPKIPFAGALAVEGTASHDGRSTQLPQAIAHRGYKAWYPENTMCAFKAAVEVGAHAIETDLHLSKDGVVVLSHDGTLKRCFGIDKKINECTWEYLSTLRTLREPRVLMPRLSDLLDYLATPQAEHLWILLDVKRDDDPEDILTRTRQTIETARTASSKDTGHARRWQDRIILGGWNEDYISLITSILPGYSAALIGFDLLYARRFLKVPNVGFNMLQKVLVGPFGARFIRDVQAAERRLFVWTVNDEEWMEWSIRKNVDGVITDDPKMFLDVCKRWGGSQFEAGERQKTSLKRKIKLYAEVAWIQILAIVLGFLFLQLNLWQPKRGK